MMGDKVPFLHFSTSGLPEVDQFEAWRNTVSVAFDVDRVSGARSAPFEARVDAYTIGNLVVSDSMQGEQAYSVTPKRARFADTDVFQIGLYRSGSYRGDANGKSITGGPGDVEVLDLTRPMEAIDCASHTICVFVPRRALQERIGPLEDLHGIDLNRLGTSRLLADYLDLIAGRLPRLPERHGEAAAAATIEMICACLRPTADLIQEAQGPLQGTLLLRAKRCIEMHLTSPRLTPEFLCGTLGISRRSLFRLFEPLQGVHKYIVDQRLNSIRRALRNPRDQRRIAELAEEHGYRCQETFWRAFKRQFGVTPGEERLLSTPQLSDTASGEVRFSEWLKQLN